MSSYDPEANNKWANSFFTNILPHLETLHRSAENAQIGVARAFVETQDQQHRNVYFHLKNRMETAQKIAQAIVDDPGSNKDVREKIFTLFPVMRPAPVVPQQPTKQTPPTTEPAKPA